MKLVRKDFDLNQPGAVKIIPEYPDDLWAVYNLISAGDVVTADTTRKVHLDPTVNTASRVKLTLPVKVTRCDFHKDSSTLCVHGRNTEASQFVATGSFHTLNLERNKSFELWKKIWNYDAVEAVRECSVTSTGSDSDLAVVLLQKHRADIYLLGKGDSTLCCKIESSSSHSGRKTSSSNVFFREIYAALVKHVNFNAVKSVVIASPESTKDEFRKFILSEAKRLKMKSIEENKSRIVAVAVGSGDLREVLGDRAVMNLMKDSRVGLEMRAFREFQDMLNNNSDRACYGPKSVESAQEMKAIETLLISDDLYRSEENETRKKYGGLVKSVKESGGKALVYSSMHVLAQQLQQLTGVAAILRFPLPDLEDMDG